MTDTEIISLWKAYDRKLEETLVLNRKNAEDITRMKVGSFLASMKPAKIFTIIAGLIWVIFVDIVIISTFSIASPFFLLSAGIQVLLTKLALGIYLYQLILIHQTDSSEPILAVQEKLARLKVSTLWVARLLFLQLPVWTTFYWNRSMLENGNVWLYILQILITASCLYLAVWLFMNIRYENRDKRWFRLLFSGKEWEPVIQSIELLEQIDTYNDSEKAGNTNV